MCFVCRYATEAEAPTEVVDELAAEMDVADDDPLEGDQEELAKQKAEAEAVEAERKRREYWPYDKYAIAKVKPAGSATAPTDVCFSGDFVAVLIDI